MSVAPRIVNEVSFVMRINHEIHFAWQAQHLVKFMCHFSWQAQHVVKFGMIAGAGNVVIFNKNLLLASAKRSLCGAAGCGLRFLGRIMLGSWSDHARNGLGSVAHWKCHFSCFQYISQRFATAILRGRRSIW